MIRLGLSTDSFNICNLKWKNIGIIIIEQNIKDINTDNVKIVMELTKMWRYEGREEWEEV